MYSEEKTVPFRLTPADLENLRLLRKRMNPSCSIQDGEEEDEMSGTSSAWYSDLEPAKSTVDKKTS